jgi:hypothetical protein
MDRGMKRGNSPETSPHQNSPAPSTATHPEAREFNGIVQGGKILLLSGELPEGTLVRVRVKA